MSSSAGGMGFFRPPGGQITFNLLHERFLQRIDEDEGGGSQRAERGIKAHHHANAVLGGVGLE